MIQGVGLILSGVVIFHGISFLYRVWKGFRDWTWIRRPLEIMSLGLGVLLCGLGAAMLLGIERPFPIYLLTMNLFYLLFLMWGLTGTFIGLLRDQRQEIMFGIVSLFFSSLFLTEGEIAQSEMWKQAVFFALGVLTGSVVLRGVVSYIIGWFRKKPAGSSMWITLWNGIATCLFLYSFYPVLEIVFWSLIGFVILMILWKISRWGYQMYREIQGGVGRE